MDRGRETAALAGDVIELAAPGAASEHGPAGVVANMARVGRHQLRRVHANQLLLGVAEPLTGPRVDRVDAAVEAGGEDGLARGGHHPREPLQVPLAGQLLVTLVAITDPFVIGGGEPSEPASRPLVKPLQHNLWRPGHRRGEGQGWTRPRLIA